MLVCPIVFTHINHDDRNINRYSIDPLNSKCIYSFQVPLDSRLSVKGQLRMKISFYFGNKLTTASTAIIPYATLFLSNFLHPSVLFRFVQSRNSGITHLGIPEFMNPASVITVRCFKFAVQNNLWRKPLCKHKYLSFPQGSHSSRDFNGFSIYLLVFSSTKWS